MSKQSEAKTAQNYRKEPNRCGNCAYYKCDTITKVYNRGGVYETSWTEDKNKRCTIGGFAVSINCVCDHWTKK